MKESVADAGAVCLVLVRVVQMYGDFQARGL